MLYTNVQRQRRVSILTQQLSECKQNNGQSPSQWRRLRLPDDLITKDRKLSLITFFSDGGCGPCVLKEVEFLNNLYIEHAPFINIYLIGGNRQNPTLIGANFEYEVIAEEPELDKLHVDNPVSVLIDRNRTIQFYHRAEIGNVEKSRVFYNRVRSLFESVYGE